MVRDITYCANESCPFSDCLRNLEQLRGENGSVIISLADFGGVCRRYLGHLVGEISEESDDLYITEENW